MTAQQQGNPARTQAEARAQLDQAEQQLREAARAAAEAAQDGRRIRIITPDGGGFGVRGISTGQGQPWGGPPGMPPGVVDIVTTFFVTCAVIVIGWPLARAFAKRIERRGEMAPAANPQLADQLQRIEQAVDAMAIEVERISESQRFLTKLQSQAAERAALPSDRV